MRPIRIALVFLVGSIAVLASPSAPAAECTLNLQPVTTGGQLQGEFAVGDDSARRFPFITGEPVAIDGLVCNSDVLVQAGQSQGYGAPFLRVWEQRRIRVDPEVSVVKYSIRPRRQVDLTIHNHDKQPVVGAGVWLRVQEGQRVGGASHTVRSGRDGRSRVFLRNDVAYEIRTLGLAKSDLKIEIDGRPADAPYVVGVGSNPVSVLILVGATATITMVVQTDAGAAVSGVDLEAFYGSERKWFRSPATTDGEGRLPLSVPTYPVVLRPADPARRYKFDPAERIVLGPDDPHEVVFRAVANDEDRLSLRFVDPESGEGVEGVRVTLTFHKDDELIDEQFAVPTDEEGAVHSTCHREARLEVEANARTGNYRRFRHETRIRDCETMNFELDPGLSVHGTVIDSAGAPVPDLGLSVANRRQRTDGQGRFSARGLGPGPVSITAYSIEDTAGSRPTVGIADENGGLRPAILELADEESETSITLIRVDPARACVQADIPEDLQSSPAITVYAFRPESESPVKDYSKQPCTAPLLPGTYQLLVYDGNGWLVPSWWPGKETRRDARMVDLPEGIRDSLKITLAAAGKLALTHDFLQDRHVWKNTVWRKRPEDETWSLLRRGVDYRYHDEGPLEIKSLPPGDWEFRLCEDDDCRGRTWVSPDPVKIVPLATATASTLPPPPQGN